MSFAILIAVPIVLATIVYFIYKSRLPVWAKLLLIAPLSLIIFGAAISIFRLLARS